MQKWLVRTTGGAVFAGALVGGIALWALTLIVAYDVFARYFGHPTIWAMEICSYLLLAVAVAGAGDALRHDAHFAVTILHDLLAPRARTGLELLLTLVLVAFAGGFGWGVWRLLQTSVMLDMRSPTVLQVPLVYTQLLLLVGAVTLVLAGILRVSQRLRTLAGRPPAGEP